MSSIQIYEQKDFTGGLNLRSDQFQLADNESPEMLNVEIDPRGGIFSRGGMKRLNTENISGTWDPHKVFAFYGESSKLLLANNTRVSVQGTGGNFTVLDYTTSTTPAASGNVLSYTNHGVCFAPWGNTLYMGLGATPNDIGFAKWSGTGTVTALPKVSTSPNTWATRGGSGGGHVPNAEHLIVHANKMFAAGTYEDSTPHPNRIRWSDESLPENWVKEDYFDIVGGGNGITALVVVNGILIIFKPYAIYALYGYDYNDFRVVNVSPSLGCHSHSALAATDSGVYFYSRSDGLFYFDGSNIVDVFQPMRAAFDLNYINPSEEDAVSVSWVGRRVWLSLPYSTTGSATYPTVNMVFDPTIRSYMLFSTADNRGVVGGCDYRTDNGEDMRIMVHPTSPIVLLVDEYDEPSDYLAIGGSPSGFATVYRTKWFDAGSFMQRKMFRRPDLVMKESEVRMTIDVDVYHDFQESDGSQARSFEIVLPTSAEGMFWDTDAWATENLDGSVYGSIWSSGVISSTIKTAKNLGLAKTVQLRFSGELNKPWGINSIGYKWTPRRVKG